MRCLIIRFFFTGVTASFIQSLLQLYTGPEAWGTKSTQENHQKKTLWPFCQQGRQQSPIDIQTERLVYDHSLKSMVISGRDEQLELIVENIGQDLQLSVLSDDVVVSGGPLSYRFQVFSMRIKFGSVSSRGSDHRIDGRSLPGELQIYAFNGELYGNYSQAAVQPHGLVAISVFLRLSNTSNKDLLGVVAASEKTIFKGQRFQLKGLEFRSLLPVTQEYMTYEGSLPFPGCCESVTWIILNYPISISELELKTLRRLRIAQTLWSGSMADNFRPVQSLNNRSIRTNINFSNNNNGNDVFYGLPSDGGLHDRIPPASV
ncbi:Carbonic anhydrase XIII [Paragonimus heterotremus]|uniref:Carbonic anhydrase XIII n=1 Tax=Paragonimus heterotremus TaxID=100268 RepID=A0A8J4TD99_9TREM|nr:Carbonic anhydrase XIII [Paragonimus heterotremus]